MRLVRLLFCTAMVLPLLAGESMGQGISDSFLTFDQFFQNYEMFNPASHDSTGAFQMKAGNSSLYGLFDGVNRMYLDAGWRPGSRGSLSYSKVGLSLQRMNRGSFIHTTRIYGRYSRTIKMTTHQYLSLGLSLGGVSLSLNGSMGVPGATATVFDGYAGIWYHYKSLRLGISMEQITKGVLQPMQQGFDLDPVLNFNMIHSLPLGVHLLLTNHLYFRKPNKHAGSLEYAPVFLVSGILETGANIKLQRGVAVLMGFRSQLDRFGKFDFMGSFLLGMRKLSSSGDNKLEITARYYL